jgi:histidine triad (HIT) family protein
MRMQKKESCIFCDIAKGKVSCHKVWEDRKHLAFLSIFPNTDGYTIVIPKKHYPSYAFTMPEKALQDLVKAAKKVGLILDKAFSDVGKTGLMFEGTGVNHVHAKLFPMHGTKQKVWQPVHVEIKKFFKKYEGYLSSHNSYRARDKKLAHLAEKIRKVSEKQN